MSRTDRAIQKLSDETDRLRELNSSLVKAEHELTNSEMMQLGEGRAVARTLQQAISQAIKEGKKPVGYVRKAGVYRVITVGE